MVWIVGVMVELRGGRLVGVAATTLPAHGGCVIGIRVAEGGETEGARVGRRGAVVVGR